MSPFSADAEAAWHARLPTLFAAAAALFTSPGGRVRTGATAYLPWLEP